MIAIQKIGKSFMGALAYNLKKFSHRNPEKRAELLDSNFASLNQKMIRQELELVRGLRPNLSRYVYHTSLSFSNEDKLDNEKLLAIAYDYLTESDYKDNQYMIFRHHDTDHPHLHLLVNRITFSGEVVSDSNNYLKSESILRKLEERYNLVSVASSKKASRKASTKDELEMMKRRGAVSEKWALQELLEKVIAQSKTISELIARGDQAGIAFLFNQASTGRVTGISYCYRGFKTKGQALGNQFKWSEIIKKVSYEESSDRLLISEANERTKAAFDKAPPMGTAEFPLDSTESNQSVDGKFSIATEQETMISNPEGLAPLLPIHLADDDDDAKKRRRRGLQR